MFIHYEEPSDESYHKTSKISLPKKWVGGPCSAVVKLFVDSYNKSAMEAIVLGNVHLATASGHALASESVVSDYIEAGADVYIKTGAAPASDADVTAPKVAADGGAGAGGGGGGGAAAMPSPPPTAAATPARSSIDTGGKPKALQCMRFGCQKKYHEADNTATSCRWVGRPAEWRGVGWGGVWVGVWVGGHAAPLVGRMGPPGPPAAATPNTTGTPKIDTKPKRQRFN